jgi:hypothetical protein
MKTLFYLATLSLLVTLLAGLSEWESGAENNPAPVEIRAEPLRAVALPPSRRAPAAPRPAVLELPAASPFQLDLTDALEKADTCKALLLVESKELVYDDALRSLLTVMGPGADLAAALAPGGPLSPAKAPLAEPRGRIARTMWALKLTGALDEGFPSLHAAGAARALFLALEKEEPRNGFFPLFRLVAEVNMGLPARQLRATAEAAATAGRIDSPLRTVDEELREASWQNPAVYMVTRFLLRVDHVSWKKAERAVKAIAEFPGADGLLELLARERRPRDERFRSAPTIEMGPGSCDASAFESWFYEARENR